MVSIFVFISIVNTYNVNRQDMLYLITFPDRSKCHYINKYIVKQFYLLYNIVKYGLTVVERSGCFYTNVLHSISCFHGCIAPFNNKMKRQIKGKQVKGYKWWQKISVQNILAWAKWNYENNLSSIMLINIFANNTPGLH